MTTPAQRSAVYPSVALRVALARGLRRRCFADAEVRKRCAVQALRVRIDARHWSRVGVLCRPPGSSQRLQARGERPSGGRSPLARARVVVCVCVSNTSHVMNHAVT